MQMNLYCMLITVCIQKYNFIVTYTLQELYRTDVCIESRTNKTTFNNGLPQVKQDSVKPMVTQACFLCTFEKTQGQNNLMFWPLAKNSRIFSQKTQSYEAQSKTW